MVECESGICRFTVKNLRVLIDTWWNVNVHRSRMEFGGYLCFNRYMVECESGICRFTVKNLRVLIDTWWNVNHINFICVYVMRMVLIDTWWNVNKCRNIFSSINFSVLIDTWWNVNFIRKSANYKNGNVF